MSTPIFDPRIRPAALGLFCLALAGCVGGLGASAPREAIVTQSAIIVTGPEGFCVDETATRDDGATAFVLLGNCAAISSSRRADQPSVPAVLTAAISAPSDEGAIADSLGELDAFFRSEQGLALLSRSQDPETVTVLDTRIEGDMFLLHASDVSAGSVEGVQRDYWRAYLDLGQRITTLSVLALEDREVSEAESLATLRAFAGAVQAANAGLGDTAPIVAPAVPVEAVQPPPSGGLFNVGLFRRIFG
ncbi:hypothetical protein KUV65_09750 [Maritalea mobilis]|uniref:hypothetical protein n=1 Tax=Maritalea mobilis TaxID=483324 RepID=UPI001C98BFE4|nr:hypothetical protein [Maritalea mobilis]MBY6201645.1 hypothetical protein [Maritalea mobilis]